MLAVAAPGSPLTSPPTPCAPHHTTPPLAAAAGGGGCGGGSVGVVACVATWSTHWLCWCCPRPCHSHTHTHGVVGTWWWWLCVCVVWLPPPLCPIPTNHHHCVLCPALSAVCACVCAWWHQAQRRTVVAPTLVCVCGCVCAVPTTPTTHAVHPCRLSLLALPIPHLPLTHMARLTPHTHMACFVCLLSSTHTHTGCLTAHTPDTHTHATGCACAHPPALIRHHTHTHTRDAQAWRMHGWLGVWSPPPRPLCPPHTHTHSGTGGGRHGGAWWCGCGLCVPPTPPTTTPSLPPPPPTLLCHHRTHTHGTWWMHHCHTHTPHAPPHSPTRAVWCPHHATHSHTPPATHTHNGACHRSPRRPHTHTHPTHATHTHHTGEGPRARTPVGVAFGEPPPPRWSWAFAVLCWWLLVHQPLFTLTHPSTPTPSSPNHHNHHHPIHPVCVVCVVWERTAPGTTVVVKHATHTPVEHCVHGSHHPTLHPPLTPLLVLFPPPTTTPSLFSTHHHHHTHTTRPLWSSTAHSSASHTHTWCGWHVALWLLSRAVCE